MPLALPDGRYAVAREFHGTAKPGHVLRFCGAWVSVHESLAEARAAAWLYEIERQNNL